MGVGCDSGLGCEVRWGVRMGVGCDSGLGCEGGVGFCEGG